MVKELVKRRPAGYAPSAGVYGYEWQLPGCYLSVIGVVGGAMILPSGLPAAMMLSTSIHGMVFSCF